MKFPIEVIQAIRQAVGPDYPVLARISADEKMPGELLGRSKTIAKDSSRKHQCDTCIRRPLRNSKLVIQPLSRQEDVSLTCGKRKVGCEDPCIAVGRINDPELAETILSEGKADLIAFGRALLADEDLPKKVTEAEFTRFADALHVARRALTSFRRASNRLHSQRPRRVRTSVSYDEGPNITQSSGNRRRACRNGSCTVSALRGHKITLWKKQPPLAVNSLLLLHPL